MELEKKEEIYSHEREEGEWTELELKKTWNASWKWDEEKKKFKLNKRWKKTLEFWNASWMLVECSKKLENTIKREKSECWWLKRAKYILNKGFKLSMQTRRVGKKRIKNMDRG